MESAFQKLLTWNKVLQVTKNADSNIDVHQTHCPSGPWSGTLLFPGILQECLGIYLGGILIHIGVQYMYGYIYSGNGNHVGALSEYVGIYEYIPNVKK